MSALVQPEEAPEYLLPRPFRYSGPVIGDDRINARVVPAEFDRDICARLRMLNAILDQVYDHLPEKRLISQELQPVHDIAVHDLAGLFGDCGKGVRQITEQARHIDPCETRPFRAALDL